MVLLVISFAAVPQSFDGPSIPKPVFNNEETTLNCPIELGRLHQSLMPYELSWDVRINSNLPEPVENPIDEERELRVDVNNTTMSNQYSCKLRLRRCCEEQRMDCGRCNIMVYTGPIISFQVFGKLFCFDNFLLRCISLLLRCIVFVSWFFVHHGARPFTHKKIFLVVERKVCRFPLANKW